ncbi:MAG: IS1 family transposase [Candidatus Altiarchaeum hamiconexum]|uniref:IS1 family transposase n=1 Tax=Candidatus Altarchaeum hamiconexum TaxID=1803513 RepID=A0A8J7YZ26_9ARCH|nr:IS1 family transposase [Candidatus Altarchaeum hamiconexum]NCN68739.1 IS1 family transposase [Candidatus Altarchaeum hamiconexum]NCS91136.1 IS1 family transposase [Candidatus Altarchaeum hamiconexum]NCT00947.1 IS1 family transposase [Candidatus Altarchaeum hamiconexum]
MKKGVVCPHCNSKENSVRKGYVNGYQNYICKNCNHSFTIRTGTVFSHSKIPLKGGLLLSYSI